MRPYDRESEPQPLEATVSLQTNERLRDADLGGIELARKAASEAQGTEAVQALLRGRLCLAFLIVTSLFCAAGCLGILNVAFNSATVAPRVLQGLTLSAGLTVALAALTALLWSSRPLSLAQLRATEVALIGLFALACGWKQLSYLDAAVDLARRFGDSGVSILATYHGAFWFALLAVYGLFVPNTWRRCAVVVALITACPFAFALAEASRTDFPLVGRPFLYYVIVLGFWAGFGAALAVFGSHHIEVLRREAREARALGQYRLTKRLGAGGMGEVYLAEHVLLRRPCAVKLIRPERVSDSRSLQQFEQEVRATATLTHPNTVEIYDYGRAEDGTFYYVMEYLPGMSLSEIVSRYGPLSPGRAVSLLVQVCGALGEAHAIGLIHRDVKPGNIMACIRGGVHDVAKLLDFGLVEARGGGNAGGSQTFGRGLAGTPDYMSPEQAAGRECLDARSDLYSLGAVAYCLLTGQPPFVRGNVLRVLAAHANESAVFPDRLKDELPADLQALVLRCLEKDPADRFADAGSLEQALAACGCAGTWTSEKAAQWWQEHVNGLPRQ